MNDNHVLHNNNLQEEKEIQLHSAHRRLSSENMSRDTTFKPGRAKLGLYLANNMVEDFVAEVTYLEYLQKERCMNDNHFFIATIYKKKKRYNFIVHTVGYPLKT